MSLSAREIGYIDEIEDALKDVFDEPQQVFKRVTGAVRGLRSEQPKLTACIYSPNYVGLQTGATGANLQTWRRRYWVEGKHFAPAPDSGTKRPRYLYSQLAINFARDRVRQYNHADTPSERFKASRRRTTEAKKKRRGAAK